MCLFLALGRDWLTPKCAPSSFFFNGLYPLNFLDKGIAHICPPLTNKRWSGLQRGVRGKHWFAWTNKQAAGDLSRSQFMNKYTSGMDLHSPPKEAGDYYGLFLPLRTGCPCKPSSYWLLPRRDLRELVLTLNAAGIWKLLSAPFSLLKSVQRWSTAAVSALSLIIPFHASKCFLLLLFCIYIFALSTQIYLPFPGWQCCSAFYSNSGCPDRCLVCQTPCFLLALQPKSERQYWKHSPLERGDQCRP